WPVNREIVGGTAPRTRQLPARLDRVIAYRIRRIAGTYVKHCRRGACIDERQDDSLARGIDRRASIQLIRQRTRWPDSFFLCRNADDYASLSRVKRSAVGSPELCRRRQKTIGARQLDAIIIRVLKVKYGRQVTRYRTAPWGNVGLEY